MVWKPPHAHVGQARAEQVTVHSTRPCQRGAITNDWRTAQGRGVVRRDLGFTFWIHTSNTLLPAGGGPPGRGLERARQRMKCQQRGEPCNSALAEEAPLQPTLWFK